MAEHSGATNNPAENKVVIFFNNVAATIGALGISGALVYGGIAFAKDQFGDEYPDCLNPEQTTGHVVKPGDTLYGIADTAIANHDGLQQTPETSAIEDEIAIPSATDSVVLAIATLSNLGRDFKIIHPGQVLTLPTVLQCN